MEKIPADTLENKETFSCVFQLILLTERKKEQALLPSPFSPYPSFWLCNILSVHYS